MDSSHDPIRHLKYLRQSLSQDNESIGFFISAGCPLSVTMPAGEWPLIPDVENLTKHVSHELSGDPMYTLLLEELQKAGRNPHNVEDVLSFLRSLALVSQGATVRGLSEQQLRDLEKSICQKIVAKINVDLPSGETPYHRVSNWIRSIDRKTAIEIFTTNYDLLVEQGLESAEVPYFDGFVGSRRSFFDLRALEDNLIPRHWTRLWKIHGSINWYQEKESGTETRKVYRSSEIRDDASHLIYPSHLKYEESRKMPYLALVDQLNRFIRKKSSLLVLCGYSFNDGHLNDCICSALKANPTAMVLALMFDTYEKSSVDGVAVERYPAAYKLAKKQHNLNVWTFDKAIIGTNIGGWRVASTSHEDAESDLAHFVTRLKGEGQDAITTVKLGDFEVFSQFLKRIIGVQRTNPHG